MKRLFIYLFCAFIAVSALSGCSCTDMYEGICPDLWIKPI